MRAASHPAEPQRLQALHGYDILDTPAEEDFDEITRLTAAVCEAPMAVMNLIDGGRQWFKSEVGLGVREVPLENSICAHAILQESFVEIPDTLEDERFCDNPLCLAEPGFRFYAGAQLRSPEGYPIGTLCVLDHRPRTLSPLQRQTVETLARQIMARLELRRALDAQQRLAREIAEDNRRKDEFLATLGHELRNPLSPIRTALSVLDRLALSDERALKATAMIGRQTEQLVRLVDDLLDMSRVAHGKIELRPATTTLGELVERAVESSRALIDARGHRLELALPPAPIRMEVDVVRVAQVLGNLLRNAARYTPEGGIIRVGATALPDRVTIRVSDNGIGIAPEDMERIFHLFGQASQSPGGGLGIGLTLARRLVELHGGTLTVRSAGIGRGSTFEVRLPSVRLPARPPEAASAACAPSRSSA